MRYSENITNNHEIRFIVIQKIESFSDDLTEFGKNLTANGKVNNPVNS